MPDTFQYKVKDNKTGKVIEGSLEAENAQLVVGKLRSMGYTPIEIQQTGEESLVIEAEDNILPLLTSEVSGRRLTLGTKPNTSISATRPIVYRLTVKDLAGIGVSGSPGVDEPCVQAGIDKVADQLK